MEGVHFPPALFLFRKIVFTLDGVLHDIAGSEVHMDSVITREFLTRWISSFGLFHSPLSIKDLVAVEWNARCGIRRGRPSPFVACPPGQAP